jgi:acetyl esterase/lipase
VQPLSDGAPVALDGAWPDRCIRRVTRAELHRFAAPGRPRGQALVVAGGGYLQLVHDKEGVQIATWLNSLDLDAHVLVHRLPGQPVAEPGDAVWPFDIALRDGLAALDHLATASPELPLLHVGLSSGGHLAGVLACQPHPLNRSQGRGVVMAYAPINANHRDHKAPPGKPDYPPPQKQAFYDAWPVGLSAHPHGVPPMPVFLAYALHDPVVPVDHALNLVKTMQQTGGSVEAHLFPDAQHGFALRELQGTHDQWPSLAARWIDARLSR